MVSQYEILEDKYIFSIHETRTNEVLENVRDMKSEVGIISYSEDNEKIMKKLFKEYQLEVIPLAPACWRKEMQR